MNNPYSSKKNKLIGNIFFEVTPIEGLKIRSQAGLNYTDIGDETFSMPSYRPNQDQGKAARSNSHAYNLSITNTAEYRFNLNHVHDFNFLIGQEGIDYQSEGFSVATAGQNNDKLARHSHRNTCHLLGKQQYGLFLRFVLRPRRI